VLRSGGVDGEALRVGSLLRAIRSHERKLEPKPKLRLKIRQNLGDSWVPHEEVAESEQALPTVP
jgi:hypothetical protein